MANIIGYVEECQYHALQRAKNLDLQKIARRRDFSSIHTDPDLVAADEDFQFRRCPAGTLVLSSSSHATKGQSADKFDQMILRKFKNHLLAGDELDRAVGIIGSQNKHFVSRTSNSNCASSNTPSQRSIRRSIDALNRESLAIAADYGFTGTHSGSEDLQTVALLNLHHKQQQRQQQRQRAKDVDNSGYNEDKSRSNERMKNNATTSAPVSPTNNAIHHGNNNNNNNDDDDDDYQPPQQQNDQPQHQQQAGTGTLSSSLRIALVSGEQDFQQQQQQLQQPLNQTQKNQIRPRADSLLSVENLVGNLSGSPHVTRLVQSVAAVANAAASAAVAASSSSSSNVEKHISNQQQNNRRYQDDDHSNSREQLSQSTPPIRLHPSSLAAHVQELHRLQMEQNGGSNQQQQREEAYVARAKAAAEQRFMEMIVEEVRRITRENDGGANGDELGSLASSNEDSSSNTSSSSSSSSSTTTTSRSTTSSSSITSTFSGESPAPNRQRSRKTNNNNNISDQNVPAGAHREGATNDASIWDKLRRSVFRSKGNATNSKSSPSSLVLRIFPQLSTFVKRDILDVEAEAGISLATRLSLPYSLLYSPRPFPFGLVLVVFSIVAGVIFGGLSLRSGLADPSALESFLTLKNLLFPKFMAARFGCSLILNGLFELAFSDFFNRTRMKWYRSRGWNATVVGALCFGASLGLCGLTPCFVGSSIGINAPFAFLYPIGLFLGVLCFALVESRYDITCSKSGLQSRLFPLAKVVGALSLRRRATMDRRAQLERRRQVKHDRSRERLLIRQVEERQNQIRRVEMEAKQELKVLLMKQRRSMTEHERQQQRLGRRLLPKNSAKNQGNSGPNRQRTSSPTCRNTAASSSSASSSSPTSGRLCRLDQTEQQQPQQQRKVHRLLPKDLTAQQIVEARRRGMLRKTDAETRDKPERFGGANETSDVDARAAGVTDEATEVTNASVATAKSVDGYDDNDNDDDDVDGGVQQRLRGRRVPSSLQLRRNSEAPLGEVADETEGGERRNSSQQTTAANGSPSFGSNRATCGRETGARRQSSTSVATATSVNAQTAACAVASPSSSCRVVAAAAASTTTSTANRANQQQQQHHQRQQQQRCKNNDSDNNNNSNNNDNEGDEDNSKIGENNVNDAQVGHANVQGDDIEVSSNNEGAVSSVPSTITVATSTAPKKRARIVTPTDKNLPPFSKAPAKKRHSSSMSGSTQRGSHSKTSQSSSPANATLPPWLRAFQAQEQQDDVLSQFSKGSSSSSTLCLQSCSESSSFLASPTEADKRKKPRRTTDANKKLQQQQHKQLQVAAAAAAALKTAGLAVADRFVDARIGIRFAFIAIPIGLVLLAAATFLQIAPDTSAYDLGRFSSIEADKEELKIPHVTTPVVLVACVHSFIAVASRCTHRYSFCLGNFVTFCTDKLTGGSLCLPATRQFFFEQILYAVFFVSTIVGSVGMASVSGVPFGDGEYYPIRSYIDLKIAYSLRVVFSGILAGIGLMLFGGEHSVLEGVSELNVRSVFTFLCIVASAIPVALLSSAFSPQE